MIYILDTQRDCMNTIKTNQENGQKVSLKKRLHVCLLENDDSMNHTSRKDFEEFEAKFIEAIELCAPFNKPTFGKWGNVRGLLNVGIERAGNKDRIDVKITNSTGTKSSNFIMVGWKIKEVAS